jgi:hypothetical protein
MVMGAGQARRANLGPRLEHYDVQVNGARDLRRPLADDLLVKAVVWYTVKVGCVLFRADHC